MKKIFIDSSLTDEIILDKEITHHLRVFRHDVHQPLTVTGSDNRSALYKISGEEHGKARASLIEFVEEPMMTHRTILVQSFLKGDKLEWVLQKATELNVDTIYLVTTANSIVKYDDKKLQAKLNRWDKITLEASQQCGRSQLPTIVINETISSIMELEKEAIKLVAYEREDEYSIKQALQEEKDDRDILICIGPEGGFQEKEINDIINSGGQSITLGPTILRAETAAIAALSMIQYEIEL